MLEKQHTMSNTNTAEQFNTGLTKSLRFLSGENSTLHGHLGVWIGPVKCQKGRLIQSLLLCVYYVFLAVIAMQGSLTYPHSLCACSVMGVGDSCVWVWMMCGEGQKVTPSMPKLTLFGEVSVSLMHSLMFLGFFFFFKRCLRVFPASSLWLLKHKKHNNWGIMWHLDIMLPKSFQMGERERKKNVTAFIWITQGSHVCTSFELGCNHIMDGVG